MKPVILSRWETDAYKLSMGQVFWQRFKGIRARYELVDKMGMSYPAGFAERLRDEIESMRHLPPHADRADYLKQKWPFMDKDFLWWYTYSFVHDPDQVEIRQEGSKISVVVEGPIESATHWEIPLLRTISCLWTEMAGRVPKPGWRQGAVHRAWEFQDKNVAWAEFGGRRPFSADVHLDALTASQTYKQKAKGEGGLIGTSWIEYAYKLGMMPIGTQAHEYTSFMGGYYGHENANKMALRIWVETYGTQLGYVLPDTYTTPVFLKDFGHGYSDLFEGSRQDSGDPYAYIRTMLAHYKKVDVDASKKSIIHSNSLRSVDEIIDLNEYLVAKYLRSFGLGGIITNNVGYPPFGIIAKLFGIWESGRFRPTIKISDDLGKAVGNPDVVSDVARQFGIER